MSRILLLFLPSLVGIAWANDIVVSIAWSLCGSLFIAIVSQTKWFKNDGDTTPFKFRLLRPDITFQLFFVLANVIGDGFYILEAFGVSLAQQGTTRDADLNTLAYGQALMLLSHASVVAGMKLAGLRYSAPGFTAREIPRGSLLYLSFGFLALGSFLGAVPGLDQVRLRVFQVSAMAVLLELTYAVAQREVAFMSTTIVVFLINLVGQVLSGWKGLIMWTMITLGALLFPLKPKVVVLGGTVFALFWLLVLHPFGLFYRPLYWNQGLDQKTAAQLSLEQTLDMSVADRIDNVWELMVGRLNEMYQLERYLTYVPGVRPYYGLELLQEALYSVVPRILWPDKPDLERLAMRRVYDAGIVVERSDVRVSAKSNLYQDGYLSAGWVGVVLASIVFGAVIMFLSRLAEYLFGGYEIGTCLIFTSLFGEVVKNAPTFVFLTSTTGASVVVLLGLFTLGRVTGWIVPSPTAQQAIPERTPLYTNVRVSE